MTTPKSPEQIMRDIYEYALTDEHNWSCVAYSEGQLCCIHERHEEKQVFEKLLRSSMASLLCHMAERMPEAKTAKELYPNVEAYPTEDYAFACEGKNMYNTALRECRTLLIEEARKITNNE